MRAVIQRVSEGSVTIDGEVRQQGSTSLMAFSVARIVSFLSSVFTLEPGDLIYTGTPEGVGPVHEGETLVASIGGFPSLTVGVRR